MLEEHTASVRDRCARAFAAQGMLSMTQRVGCTLQARESSAGGEEMAVGQCLSRKGKIEQEG